MKCYQDSSKKARIVYLKEDPVCVAFVGRVAVLRDRTVEAGDRPIPKHIHIRWPDGSETALPHLKVRESCSCARCVDEYTGKQILDVASIPPDIEVEDIQPLGNYAVSITWSDGHGSGIYSWNHLRRLA